MQRPGIRSSHNAMYLADFSRSSIFLSKGTQGKCRKIEQEARKLPEISAWAIIEGEYASRDSKLRLTEPDAFDKAPIYLDMT